MMKKIVGSFAVIFGLAFFASAQTTTNTRILKQASVGYKMAFEANYAKALSLAKRKGWDLTILSRDGRKGVLVGVDDFGFPKYYMTVMAGRCYRFEPLWQFRLPEKQTRGLGWRFCTGLARRINGPYYAKRQSLFFQRS